MNQQKRTKEYWIEQLGLIPHPEGGYYKEVLESDDLITHQNKKRKLYTSIYFLLTNESPSHFHRLTADEIWYYHDGSSLSVHEITSNGAYQVTKLGNNLEHGEVLQAVVNKNTIFGSTVEEPNSFALVSCMVCPGFTYEDFELFTKVELLEKYPQHADIISRLAYTQKPKH